MTIVGAPARIRVLLVEDHVLVRAGLRMLLEADRDLQVVGEVASVVDALRAAAEDSPDVILLDLDLGGESGLDLIGELRRVAPHARVLVLTALRDAAQHRQAIELGAVGVVLKDQSQDVLAKALKKVHAGEFWVGRALTATLLAERARPRPVDPDQAKIATLTPREREVIALVGRGLRNQAIADQLVLSEATVRHHLTSVFAKLEVADRLELVIFAFRHGLADLR